MKTLDQSALDSVSGGLAVNALGGSLGDPMGAGGSPVLSPSTNPFQTGGFDPFGGVGGQFGGVGAAPIDPYQCAPQANSGGCGPQANYGCAPEANYGGCSPQGNHGYSPCGPEYGGIALNGGAAGQAFDPFGQTGVINNGTNLPVPAGATPFGGVGSVVSPIGGASIGTPDGWSNPFMGQVAPSPVVPGSPIPASVPPTPVSFGNLDPFAPT